MATLAEQAAKHLNENLGVSPIFRTRQKLDEENDLKKMADTKIREQKNLVMRYQALTGNTNRAIDSFYRSMKIAHSSSLEGWQYVKASNNTKASSAFEEAAKSFATALKFAKTGKADGELEDYHIEKASDGQKDSLSWKSSLSLKESAGIYDQAGLSKWAPQKEKEQDTHVNNYVMMIKDNRLDSSFSGALLNAHFEAKDAWNFVAKGDYKNAYSSFDAAAREFRKAKKLASKLNDTESKKAVQHCETQEKECTNWVKNSMKKIKGEI